MPLNTREKEALIRKGADAEFVRLQPRMQKLKDAVAEREETIASMTKEMRALRVQVMRQARAPALNDATLASLEESARSDAQLIFELRKEAKRNEEKLWEWMRWAWVGQPDSAEDAEHAVYKAKIAMLQHGLAYWERRARNEYPANKQVVADTDAAVDFSCRHLRLNHIISLMDPY